MAVENGPTEYDLGRAAPMRCTLPPAAPLRAAGLSGVLDSSDIRRVVSGRPARISLRSRRDALDCCFPQPSERARRLAQHYRSGRIASVRRVSSWAPASAYARREAAVSDCRFPPLDRPASERLGNPRLGPGLLLLLRRAVPESAVSSRRTGLPAFLTNGTDPATAELFVNAALCCDLAGRGSVLRRGLVRLSLGSSSSWYASFVALAPQN